MALKYSKQRSLVLQAVQARPVHPTASTIYNQLRKDHPKISLGTVYRNLNQLSEQGMILKLHMPEAGDRYDGCVVPHAHLVCSDCGAVMDCDLEGIEKLKAQIFEASGFELDERNLVFKGLCEHCVKVRDQGPMAPDTELA